MYHVLRFTCVKNYTCLRYKVEDQNKIVENKMFHKSCLILFKRNKELKMPEMIRSR